MKIVAPSAARRTGTAGDMLVVLRISKDPNLKLLFAALFMLTIPALAAAATGGPQLRRVNRTLALRASPG